MSVGDTTGVDVMGLLALEYWPLWFICLEMIAIAAQSALGERSRGYSIPHKFSGPFMLGGWLLGLLHDLGTYPFSDAGRGGLGASLTATGLGCLLLLLLWMMGSAGGGLVKLEMAFGAWAGAFYGLRDGILVVLYSFLAAVLATLIIALIYLSVAFLIRLRDRRPPDTPDTKRRLMPGAIPMAIGTVGYLVWRHW
jgi:Flp pilus assembly protein protease CpaA